MKFSNGDVYEGNFNNGERSEVGVYKYKNGDNYKGEWKSDKKEG